MGCDIHYVLERKTKDGKWLGIYTTDGLPYNGPESRPLPKRRDYYFFAEIANVRGESRHGDARNPKGIPDDASDLSKECVTTWGVDGHSHSHLSAADFCQSWLDAYDRQTEYFHMLSAPPATIEAWQKDLRERVAERLEAIARIREYPTYRLLGYENFGDQEPPEHRVVFWFDN